MSAVWSTSARKTLARFESCKLCSSTCRNKTHTIRHKLHRRQESGWTLVRWWAHTRCPRRIRTGSRKQSVLEVLETKTKFTPWCLNKVCIIKAPGCRIDVLFLRQYFKLGSETQKSTILPRGSLNKTHYRPFICKTLEFAVIYQRDQLMATASACVVIAKVDIR